MTKSDGSDLGGDLPKDGQVSLKGPMAVVKHEPFDQPEDDPRSDFNRMYDRQATAPTGPSRYID